MKKFFYVFLSCAMLSMLPACGPDEPTPDPDVEETPEYLDKSKNSQMVVTLGASVLTKDTTVEVTEVTPSLSGALTMEVSGTVSGVSAFRVTATRSEEGQKEELCAGTCMISDGELTQNFDFTIGDASTTTWKAHYTPAKQGVYTVKYSFQNYNRTLNLTVKYNYTAE